MLYTSFKNYEEFKELFPIREYNGVRSRQNKILLALYKSGRWFFHSPLRGVRSMPELEDKCLEVLEQRVCIDDDSNDVNIMGRTFHSHEVRTDNLNGICEDGDYDKVRVHIVENDRERLCKRKAGKFMRAIIAEHHIGQNFPPEVINYLCEQFTTKWKAYVNEHDPRYELHVDTHFDRIYSRSLCVGNFHSCMTGQGHHSFYRDCIDDAKAAYITRRSDNHIVARAVIFNALDENGREWRLLERQYTTDCNDVLKQLLVNKLIAAGAIDGYKAVGADCHNSRNFVDVNGSSLSDKTFHIACRVSSSDTVSYQDTFKWYYPIDGFAYNRNIGSGYVSLDTTGRTVNIRHNYDSYHRCYTTSHLVSVYAHGERLNCDANHLEDFECVLGVFYHRDEVMRCRITGYSFQTAYPALSASYGYFCSQLGEWFHDADAAARAVTEYEQQNFVTCADNGERHDASECFYSELLDQYFWFESGLEEAERSAAANAA